MDRKEELLLKFAVHTMADIDGCSVHACEDFDPEELLVFALGEEKIFKLLELALLERQSGKEDFNLDVETFEMVGNFKGLDFRKKTTDEERKQNRIERELFYKNKISYHFLANIVRYGYFKNLPNVNEWYDVLEQDRPKSYINKR